jgi:hypothetical protein
MRSHGTCPAELEVYDRADGAVRFRIARVGSQDVAVVDLLPAEVDELIIELTRIRREQGTK